MKRLDIVQLTLMIAGIMSAFFALEAIPDFLDYLFIWVTKGLSGGFYMELFIRQIISLSLYLIFTIYVIKYAKQLAAYICDKANMDGDIQLNIDKKELLYVFFISLSIYGLIKYIPLLTRDVYELTRHTVAEPAYTNIRETKDYVFEGAARIGLFIILLVYARTFAEYLSVKIKNVEPPDEINSTNS